MSLKLDEGKLRHDLIDPYFDEAIAEVLTDALKKYVPNSWQDVPQAEERYLAALKRHLNAFEKGEPLDKESGLHHLAHAACNVMFMLYFERNKNIETADIRKPGHTCLAKNAGPSYNDEHSNSNNSEKVNLPYRCIASVNKLT